MCVCLCLCLCLCDCGCGFLVLAENELGAEGMVALAPALSKLVSLTSLNLSRT